MSFDIDDDDLEAIAAKNWVPAEVVAFLRQADRFELFSIDPEPGPKGEPRKRHRRSGGFTLQQWPILGSVVIDSSAGRAIVETLVRGCEGWDGGDDDCRFEPRHGLRATAGDRSVDLIICFVCGHMVSDWSNGHQYHYLEGLGPRGPELWQQMTDLLYQAGVPLAEDPNA
jgi:hypothetical protein